MCFVDRIESCAAAVRAVPGAGAGGRRAVRPRGSVLDGGDIDEHDAAADQRGAGSLPRVQASRGGGGDGTEEIKSMDGGEHGAPVHEAHAGRRRGDEGAGRGRRVHRPLCQVCLLEGGLMERDGCRDSFV